MNVSMETTRQMSAMARIVNVDRINATIFISTIGPATKNAVSAPGLNVCAKASAKNASTLEQIATMNPRAIMARIPSTGSLPTLSNTSRGTKT